MKITEIVSTVGQTIQVKQYEPRSYQSTVKVSLEEGESVEEALAMAREVANNEVRDYFVGLNNKEEKPVEKKLDFQLKPDILSHPNIPKPLHGIAPRTIKGVTWWNKTRKEVYAKTDDHCVACGVHKSDAKARKWMEAHEYWDIDYDKGTAEVSSIEPLCHYCHNFIHSGRLTAIVGKEKSEDEVKNILEHGFTILANNKLQCFPVTMELAEQLGVDTKGVTAYPMPESTVEWGDWKVIFEGKEYKSKFKNIKEWEDHYNKENK